MQYDRDVSYLGDMQMPLGFESETRLRIRDAVNTGFEPRETLLTIRRVFNPSEEILKRFSDSVRDILFHLGEYIRVFSCEKLVVVKLPHGFTSGLIGADRCFKKIVVDFFACFKIIKKTFSLCMRGIQTKAIHPNFHAEYKPGTCYLNITMLIDPLVETSGILSRIL
jgi:hypothetical protein